jgi:acyl carrier protein
VTLEEIIGSVLDIDPSELDDATSQGSLDGWDSLAHISLISAVEESFGVELSTEEMRRGVSVGELRQILADKGVSA